MRHRMLIIPRLQGVGSGPAYLSVPLCARHASGPNPEAHDVTHPLPALSTRT